LSICYDDLNYIRDIGKFEFIRYKLPRVDCITISGRHLIGQWKFERLNIFTTIAIARRISHHKHKHHHATRLKTKVKLAVTNSTNRS